MDIRKFLKQPGAGAQAAKPPPTQPARSAEQPPPVKKSKFFKEEDEDDSEIEEVKPQPQKAAAKTATTGQAGGHSRKVPKALQQESPAKASPKKPAANHAAASKGAAAAGSKRRRKVISDDEEEEQEDNHDSDVVMLVDSSDEEVVAKPKAKATPKATPASQPTPATKAKRGAAAGGAAGSSRPKSASKKAALSPEAQAAVDAVDGAVAALPDEDGLQFSFMPEGGGGGSNDAVEPPNHNNKETPLGHPECLTGKTFVVSGVLDSLYREEAAELIRRHSGRVTGAVSSRTTFLVVGHNCGRSKFSDAKRHNVKLIDEDGLFSMIRASAHLVQLPVQSPQAGRAAASPPTAAVKAAPASAPSALLLKQEGPAPMDVDKPVRPSGGPASMPARATTAKQPQAGTAARSGPVQSQLWVDKYKPSTSKDLVGNPGHIRDMAEWLRHWEAVHLRGAPPPAIGGANASKSKDWRKKALLLSGPPGIGKTSAAHIVGREAGYKVVEMNASDTRNKSDVKVSAGMGGKQSNVVREMVANTSLLFDGGGEAVKQVLVMDEVDGMSGGDRGGVADLIATIKKSKIPIICICNDKYNQKLKSLRNQCVELDFRKPTDEQMARRLALISAAEGLQVNDATLREMARGTQGDMRLCLGQLQMVRVRKQALTFDDVKGKLGTSKDSDMSPFECARKLLDPAASRMKTTERLELYFADSDLVPLLVQENYINHKPNVASDDKARMRAIAKAADCFSAGDVVSTALRRTNNWTLAPTVGVVGTLMPCAYMAGPRETFGLFPGEMNFPRFSAWFGNYSTSTKQRRLLSELTTSMAASGHVPLHKSQVRLDYCSALRSLLTQPIITREEEGIEQTLETMQEYCINREQWDYVQDVTKFRSKAVWAVDRWSSVPAKVKSAFTRRFNAEGLVARYGGMVEAAKKGRAKKVAGGKKRAAAEDDEDEDMGEGEEGRGTQQQAEEEEEEDEEERIQELQRRLGGQFMSKAPGGGSSGRGRGSRGGGRGSGRASTGRGSGKASGSGGRGRGAAKK